MIGGTFSSDLQELGFALLGAHRTTVYPAPRERRLEAPALSLGAGDEQLRVMLEEREQAGAFDPATKYLERARDALGGWVGDVDDDVSRPHRRLRGT